MGTVSDLHGSVTLIDPVAGTSALRAGQTVFEGQTLTTREDGEVHIATIDGAVIALRPNSSLRIEAYRANRNADDRIHLALVKGALRSITGWVARLRQDAYQLRTATATIGVRGTDHETIDIDLPQGTLAPGVYERVHQGATVVRSERDEIEVRAGQVGFVSRDRRERPRLLDGLPPALKDRVFRLDSRLSNRREASVDQPANPLTEKQLDRLRSVQEDTPQDAREKMTPAPGEVPATESRERAGTMSGDASQEPRERLRNQLEEASPEQRERLRNAVENASPEQRERLFRQQVRRPRPNS